MIWLERRNSAVAFDIGTSSVSAALFEVPGKAAKPSIIKTFRRFHKQSPQKDALHFGKSTISQFSGIMKEIEKFSKSKMPALYTIGLSSVFYFGRTERFYIEHKDRVPLKESEIEGIIEEGKKKLISELKRDDIVFFETIIMKTLLNGYPIAKPVGRVSDNVEIWIRYSATSRDLHVKFIEITQSFNPHARVMFTTLPVATRALIFKNLLPQHSALVVDIGGELTEVTFLADGVITEVLVLPFGVLNILIRISEAEHVDIPNAFSLLKGYTEGALDETAARRLQATIKKEMRGWEEIFERVWQRVSHDMMSNIRMYFLGGGAFIEEVKAALTPPLLHPEIARDLSVSIMNPQAFRNRFGNYCCLEGPNDFGLLSFILAETK